MKGDTAGRALALEGTLKSSFCKVCELRDRLMTLRSTDDAEVRAEIARHVDYALRLLLAISKLPIRDHATAAAKIRSLVLVADPNNLGIGHCDHPSVDAAFHDTLSGVQAFLEKQDRENSRRKHES